MRQTKFTAKVLFRLIFTFGLIFRSAFGFSQLGCTDPQATNYNAAALENDGSCLYAPTSYSLDFLTELPAVFTETSGLAYLNGELWTHNDGGNEDKIYTLDPDTGEPTHTVIIATADNNDWEDMTQNEDYLFVGDFGNNSGDRTDLSIYRIDRADLDAPAVNADEITFVYEDQTDFSTSPFQTNFDCEAMIYMNDSLHIFTKHWLDYKTKHYVLAAEPGAQTAFLRDSFDVQLLITAADLAPNGEITLLGWNPVTGNAAFWILFDYSDQAVFKGNKRRINIGFASDNSQPEGLVFSGNYSGFISSENFLQYPQRLLSFSIESWVTNAVSNVEVQKEATLKLFPNPGNAQICWETDLSFAERLQIYNSKGVLVYEIHQPNSTCIDLPYLATGQYQIRFQFKDQVILKRWVLISNR